MCSVVRGLPMGVKICGSAVPPLVPPFQEYPVGFDGAHRPVLLRRAARSASIWARWSACCRSNSSMVKTLFRPVVEGASFSLEGWEARKAAEAMVWESLAGAVAAALEEGGGEGMMRWSRRSILLVNRGANAGTRDAGRATVSAVGVSDKN